MIGKGLGVLTKLQLFFAFQRYEEEASELLSENNALRRHLEEALLRLEGYEIMGDILQEDTVSTC